MPWRVRVPLPAPVNAVNSLIYLCDGFYSAPPSLMVDWFRSLGTQVLTAPNFFQQRIVVNFIVIFVFVVISTCVAGTCDKSYYHIAL